MTKALMVALTIIVAGVTAGSAQAGFRHWDGYIVYGPDPYCGYTARRRGHPSAIEFYFVYHCVVPPRTIHYRHPRKVLRSRG